MYLILVIFVVWLEKFLWPERGDASDTAQAQGIRLAMANYPSRICCKSLYSSCLECGDSLKHLLSPRLHPEKHTLKEIFKRITIYIVLLVCFPLVWQIIYNLERSESF